VGPTDLGCCVSRPGHSRGLHGTFRFDQVKAFKYTFHDIEVLCTLFLRSVVAGMADWQLFHPGPKHLCIYMASKSHLFSVIYKLDRVRFEWTKLN